MGITTELSRDLFQIQPEETDREQLRTLIIDFFAAAYAGYEQNRAFNRAVEAVVYPQGGAENRRGLLYRSPFFYIKRALCRYRLPFFR